METNKISRFNFRIWVVTNNGGIMCNPLSLGFIYGTVSSDVIMQSTGLTDSNGQEIYEGDIVNATKSNSYLNGFYEVAWHDQKGRWYYKNQPTYKDLYQIAGGNMYCEVVGNIYENPEIKLT